MHSFPSPGAGLVQPLSRHLPNIALQKSSTLLSVSSGIIYEITVEIQNLDDEFYLLFRTRTRTRTQTPNSELGTGIHHRGTTRRSPQPNARPYGGSACARLHRTRRRPDTRARMA